MSFSELIDDMDEMLMSSLSDGSVDHLSASGVVLAAGLEAIVERDVERVSQLDVAVDRVVTLEVRKSLLGSFDRKGGFRASSATPIRALGTQLLHIDGIASDDGHMITFYLVP